MEKLSLAKQKETEAKLDRIAEQWHALPKEGNEALKTKLAQDIFTYTFQLYDTGENEGEMAVLDTFQKAMETFDPEKQKFSHYFSFLLKRKKVDVFRYEKCHSSAGDSMNKPVGEEGKSTPEDFLEDKKEQSPEQTAEFRENFLQLTASVLNFAQRHRGKASPRKQWFSMFYTEDITFAAKSVPMDFLHEKDIFDALHTVYLDFYMAEECRSLKRLSRVPMKSYGEVVPAQAGKTGEIPLPIPADVSLAFLEQNGQSVGKSARSNQMKPYKELKNKILKGEPL